MKISARNKIRSKINNIIIKELISTLELQTVEPSIITAVITRYSADEMDLKEGDMINIIIKPTEVIIKEIED